MDESRQHGYPFDNASMTESCCVEWGHCRCPPRGLGEGTKLRFVTSLRIRGTALLGAAALCIALPGAITTLGNSAYAGGTLEERKLPMHFNWVECQPDCKGWVSAVGIVTADSPREFDEFARGRQLDGSTIVLDSSGGSVNDSIALGRRFRSLGALTTVGVTVVNQTAARRTRQRDAGSLLRVDVRLPAVVGQDALRAGRGACPRAPDLDG